MPNQVVHCLFETERIIEETAQPSVTVVTKKLTNELLKMVVVYKQQPRASVWIFPFFWLVADRAETFLLCVQAIIICLCNAMTAQEAIAVITFRSGYVFRTTLTLLFTYPAITRRAASRVAGAFTNLSTESRERQKFFTPATPFHINRTGTAGPARIVVLQIEKNSPLHATCLHVSRLGKSGRLTTTTLANTQRKVQDILFLGHGPIISVKP